jgi:hypothetical protein
VVTVHPEPEADVLATLRDNMVDAIMTSATPILSMPTIRETR